MIYPASSLSGHFYRRIIKPILFRNKPDAVHEGMLKSGKIVQKSRFMRAAMHTVWAYDKPARLSQDIAGITFKSPVGLSAGFDKNFDLVPLIKSVGFGFMEGGSVTLEPCTGNPRPWFHRLPKTKSIVVHVGLANKGTEAALSRIQEYPDNTLRSFPLNISIAKTNSQKVCDDAEAVKDYIGSLELIQAARIGTMITLNISCPNTYGGEPFTTPARLERLLAAVDMLHIDKPIFIKMPIDLPWEDFKKLLEVIDRHKITGVTIGNLAKNRAQMKLKDPLPETVKGNMSGKPTWHLSNALIKQTRKAYGNRFVIIGVGGILTAEDAYTKIRLGADIVELITGMIFEGPQVVGQINRGLVRLLDRDGYKHISEAVGVDAQ